MGYKDNYLALKKAVTDILAHFKQDSPIYVFSTQILDELDKLVEKDSLKAWILLTYLLDFLTNLKIEMFYKLLRTLAGENIKIPKVAEKVLNVLL